MESINTILKYIDVFGISFTFYREKMPKLYTVSGGIFSFITLISAALILILFCLDDLKRKFPITTTTFIPTEGYRNVKFGKEKLWIPWSIVDYNNNEYVNHTEILFPIIYYISAIKDEITKEYKTIRKILDYKLCNETSMAEEKNYHDITVSLDKIYCIDMEELDMGGSWMSSYINYIQFDLYYCQNGINYNETNDKCTSFNKLKNFLGDNNSLDIEFYYPIVQFQPTNKTNPVVIIYQQNFYHLSKYVNKIERIYLQEHKLTDDSGWMLKHEKNSSYWGLDSITGETYFNGDENDIFNEGSNSRAYSFNLYLNPGIIHYKRAYKKIYTIFSDNYPISYIIFFILKSISMFLKKVESNKRMIELLFENFKDKPNDFEESMKRIKEKSTPKNKRNNSNNNKTIDKSLLRRKSVDASLFYKNFGNSSRIINNNLKISNVIKTNINNINNNMQNNNIHNNNNINININNNFINKQKRKSLMMNSSKQNLILENNKQNFTLEKNYQKSLKSSNIKENNTIYRESIFPYKYYLFSIFIKNLNTSKKNIFFSSRFSKIYIFYSQLFDIATYLLLQREFNALKALFHEKDELLLEKNKKATITYTSFIKEINDLS